MTLNWHCVRGYWFYGTSMSKQVPPPADDPRPAGIIMYTEGPCAAINTQLRTGKAVYKTEENLGVEFETVIKEIDSCLDADGEVPAVVVREDDGQLEAAIENGFVIDLGYLSTTKADHYIGTDRAVRYMITGLQPGCGRSVEEFSQYRHEKEFLFKRNSKFVVKGKRNFTRIGEEGTEYFLEYVGTATREPSKKEFQAKPVFHKCWACNSVFTEYAIEDGWQVCPCCGAN